MHLEKCAQLTRFNVNSTWYRAVELRYAERALETTHTRTAPSRFCSGSHLAPGFETLYLAQTPATTVLEKRMALEADAPFIVIPMRVILSSVVDLTIPREAELIGTNAQELTGDWNAYSFRTMQDRADGPHAGEAPTQRLGRCLYLNGGFQGLISFSAVDPRRRVLVVFRERLHGTTSAIQYMLPDSSPPQAIQIP